MQELERDQNLPVIIADRKQILWKLEKYRQPNWPELQMV